MRSLLDVNVLLALFDPGHAHHSTALNWWSQKRGTGWASCPLSQNGFIRVISNPAYPRPLTVADAVALIRAQSLVGNHAFWHDDISLTDADLFDRDHMLGHRQLTDIYLLALAVKNGGALVTFDRGVSLHAVRGAQSKNLNVIQ